MMRVSPLSGAKPGVVITHDNITARCKAEQSLREREEILSQIFRLSPAIIAITREEDGRYVDVNDAFTKLIGYSRKEVMGRTALGLWVNPDDRLKMVESLRRDGLAHNREVFFTCKSGALLPCVCSMSSIEIKGERCIVSVAMDISERKRAEDALRESEMRLVSILNSMPDMVLQVDREMRILWANLAALEINEHAIGQTCYQAFPGRASVCEGCPCHRAFLTGEIETGTMHQSQSQTAGESYWENTGIPQKNSLNEVISVIEISRNITERIQAEEEKEKLQARLLQTQKTESLGRMAGAIAHNFNNMLGAVIGNLDMALDGIPHGSELETCIREALKASQQASKISRFMLTYLGQTTEKLESLDPAAAIREACSLLSSSLPGNVHLKADIPSRGPTIKADRAHLTQILTNLIANAAEAIGDRQGEIDLTLDVIPGASVGNAKLFPLGWEPKTEEYISLSIADTGCGIDPEHFDKIFDPFFTTKFSGRGLGLSVVAGLLRALGGAISVESHPGSGATFKLYLPVSRQVQPEIRRDEAQAGSLAKEDGLVLVVDDEAMVRSMAETMLKRKLGFEVITAADGKEALEIFKERKGEISLIMLDLSMPGMNGWETLSALRSLRPDISVILASGYDEAQVMRDDCADMPQAFLHKPFGVDDLKAAIVTVRKHLST